ncbi:putative transmembrane protein [Wenzhou Myotis davidii paramyxovirus 1]|uniref:Transmembrane protein n=1 Tax=Wenzhou Myotis davidii paramyxovirus 1 TaxID=2928979 RepID=A0A8T9KLZ3_9MONO|nr:putative transmembrane protein [Wenzhou Myotis davidii paramyxovirus 1]
MDGGNSVNFNNTFNFSNSVGQDNPSNRHNHYEPVNIQPNNLGFGNMPRIPSPHHQRYGIYYSSRESSKGSNHICNIVIIILGCLMIAMISTNLWLVITVKSIINDARITAKRPKLPDPIPYGNSHDYTDVLENTMRSIMRDTAYNIPQLIKEHSCSSEFSFRTKAEYDRSFDLDFEMSRDKGQDRNSKQREKINVKIDLKNKTQKDQYKIQDKPSGCDDIYNKRNCQNHPTSTLSPGETTTLIPSHRPRGPPGSRSRFLDITCRDYIEINQRFKCSILDNYYRDVRRIISQVIDPKSLYLPCHKEQ